jgi:fatty acid desaturase
MAAELNSEPLRPSGREWITLLVILGVYAALAGLLWWTPRLPWWAVILPAGYLVALHSSLQHEALHGHPTRSRLLNEALIFINPSFWFPYRRYSKMHLQHHNDEHLTDPTLDPESYYMLPDHWAQLPAPMRQIYMVHNTLAGRIVLGPVIGVIRFWSAEAVRMLRGDREVLRAWLLHVPACGITIAYATLVCGVPLWLYLLLFAYPGIGLSLVRSFCEHQAVRDVGERTIVVESGPVMSFVFLNNNLHVAHHVRPRLAWYDIPAFYRQNRQQLLAHNRGYLMHGYREIARRFLLRPKEPVAYPDTSYLQR